MKKKLVILVCLFVCLNVIQAQNNAITTMVEPQSNTITTMVKPQQCNGNIPEYIATQTRNDTVMTVQELQQTSGPLYVCTNIYERVVVYAENCSNIHWSVNGIDYDYDNNPMIFDSQVNYVFVGGYNGCGIGFEYAIVFRDPNVPTETTEELWKRQHDAITLEAPGGSYDYLWSTGETTATIEVIEPGTYTCGVSDMCATSVQTFIVRDNVELYRATVDLGTNLNKTTWQTTPAQAQYINQVKVERDGMIVGTVPYTQGYFMDNIGSENAARNYRLTGILYNGTECPIPSYQKGTLSTFYSPDATDPNMVNMSWDAPFIEEGAPCSVTYFQICKYNASTGEVTVIDQLGANVHFGKYNMDLFDGEYGVIAALFNDGKSRDIDDLTFSNRSAQEILGIDENEVTAFKVYPNPANGVLFVETRRATSLPMETYRIMNPIGQTVMQGQITSEKQQIDVRGLSNGVYFITVGGATRKFVVE